MLEAFLDFHRETLIEKCMDLSGEELAIRPVATSLLSLQGLVRHMAKVERWWFRMYMCGMPLPPLNTSKEHPDLDFEDVDPARWQEDLEVYRGEVDHWWFAARRAIFARVLDTWLAHGRVRRVLNLGPGFGVNAPVLAARGSWIPLDVATPAPPRVRKVISMLANTDSCSRQK